MRGFSLAAALLAAATLVLPAVSAAQPAPSTVTGIPLDAPWKTAVYALAKRTFVHPAWGWQHSERNYNLATMLAKDDGIAIDSDVLFAACFLHDMAAFEPYASRHKGMEHGDAAAIESEAVLRNAGFPMAKFARVQAAERGHMHDADSLDFLGAVGAARMLSLTGANSPSFAGAVKSLRGFVTAIPPKLLTKTGARIGKERAQELRAFLDGLQAEDPPG
ncbi:MAG TPA: HD domain-containing protein [Candidatus Baltobacteraceae bacterium]|nr:HD domain-containing protein [Candidatus Baltobacteraceae bacterium]